MAAASATGSWMDSWIGTLNETESKNRFLQSLQNCYRLPPTAAGPCSLSERDPALLLIKFTFSMRFLFINPTQRVTVDFVSIVLYDKSQDL